MTLESFNMSNENEVTVDIFTVFQNTTGSSSFTIKDSFNYAPSLYQVRKNDNGVIYSLDANLDAKPPDNKTTRIFIWKNKFIYEYGTEYVSDELYDKFLSFDWPYEFAKDEYATSRGWLKTRKFVRDQIINSYM